MSELQEQDVLYLKSLIVRLEARVAKLEAAAPKGAEDKSPQVSRDQQKKVHALYDKMAKHSGHNKEEIKNILKTGFLMKFGRERNIADFSLSKITSKEASEFIDYIIIELLENDVSITPEDVHFYTKTKKFMHHMAKAGRCCICNSQDAKVSKYREQPFSLCQKHIDEFYSSKAGFVKTYHLGEYFTGNV